MFLSTAVGEFFTLNFKNPLHYVGNGPLDPQYLCSIQ
jgi:hypothetical protein